MMGGASKMREEKREGQENPRKLLLLCFFVLLMIFNLLFLVFCFCDIDLDSFIIDPKIIEKINTDPTSTWTAGVNSIFAGKTYREMKPYFGMYGFHKDPMKYEEDITSSSEKMFDLNDLPTHFDVYTQWPQCKLPIRDQGMCGAIHAFSTTSVMSDRICVASKGETKILLSPQDILSCERDQYGCSGGYIDKTWDYVQNVGVVSEDCFPFYSGHQEVGKCPYQCKNSENFNTTKHKIKSWRKLKSDDTLAMKDLMTFGSFQAFFSGYQDFLAYKKGVYQHKWGGISVDHLVKVQGWGVDSESGLDYWNLALDWGTEFGMEGYVWILRGKDECGFEDHIISPTI